VLLVRAPGASPGRETGGSLHTRLAELAPERSNDALAWLKQCRAPRIPQAMRGRCMPLSSTTENFISTGRATH